MTTPNSAFLAGTTDGRLYLVDSAGTSANAISEADFNTLSAAGYQTLEVSDGFLNAIPVVHGTGLG